jgi:hypothetical protein
MKRVMQLCPLLGVALLIACSISRPAYAQAPVGTISGVVADESGAVIPNAAVKIRNKATGAERDLMSNAEGAFSAPALPAGVYEMRVELKGFRTVVREATVETGLTTTADVRLPIGQTSEVVNVEAATAQVEYEKHAIDGVVSREQIQDLPLNGRSFLQLASIEPGVNVGTGTTSQYNSLFNVSILGGGSGSTAISVDGGSIRDPIDGGASMNFSQEVVQEFQVSAVNFDLSTDITSVGSVNVVTRTGSNQFHGSGYFYFRDHNMAAYPNLVRDPLNSSPFFARRNPGFYLGGPLKKDKLFFFFNYEYMNQTQNYSVVPNLPSVATLGGNFGSPYAAKEISIRFDYRLDSRTNLFARYSHDGNSSFGPSGSSAPLPSNWLRNVNWSDQSILGATTAVKPTLVNDFRFSYQFWSNRNLFPNSSDCAGCLGLDGPQLTFAGISSNFEIGDTSNATQGRDLRHFVWQDSLTWQKGNHRMKFGGLFDHSTGTGFWGYCDPSCVEVFSPEFVEAQFTGALAPLLSVFFPNLPKTIKSNADLLNLPFAGSVVGIGDPSQPPPFNQNSAKVNDRSRIYFQDTWKITPKFTFNYGLAYEYETNLYNEDLAKPAYLAPLYGSNLSPTQPYHGEVSPLIGFAWNVGHDNKTVIRGGAGKYYDTVQLYQRLQERSEIGPVGNGRVEYPYTGYNNMFPGIINVATQKPINVGSPLPASALTTLTLGQYEQIQAAQTPGIATSLATPVPGETPIAVSKSGSDLYPHNFPVPDAYHISLGAQRELRRDMVLSADFVRRVYLNEQYGAIDINRFSRYINGVPSPVIPVCTGSQASNPAAECSTGGISFWQPGERGTYTALLVKVEKRFAHRFQFTASYALQSQMGVNGIVNLDNYNESWGPQAARNILHIVGTVQLPWGFQLGLVSSTSSRGPINPVVGGIDINGNGSGETPLTLPSYNCINISCGKGALVTAVANWNSTEAGKLDGTGKKIPTLTLPANYNFGRANNSQDIRLTKTFTYHERYKLSVFGEMFNVLNYANYGGYTFDPSSSAFGTQTQRATQVFGSGGPRAVQVGGRISF